MKDLDFDELDRAVNSLISNGTEGNNNNNNNNTDDSKIKPTTVRELPRTPLNSHFADSISSDAVSVAEESMSESVSLPTPTINPTSTSAPVPAPTPDPESAPVKDLPVSTAASSSQSVSPLVSRRSFGRFMDVVHPSSDMRTALVMPERVSRQGNTIDPTSDNQASSEPPVVAEPKSKPIVEHLLTESTAPVNEWPDPINFNTEFDNHAMTIDEDDDSDIDQINDDITNTLGQVPEVQESPFLSGAKVFKRPLGAFSSEQNNPAAESSDTAEVSEAEVVSNKDSNDNPIINNKIDASAPLPPELQSDLLSIEAGCEVADSDNSIPKDDPAMQMPSQLLPVESTVPVSAPTPNRTAPITAPARSQPQSQVQPQPKPQSQIQTNPVNTGVVHTSKPTVDSPTSISQQYQEKPSTGDQNSGAIYDTDSYHKAVVRPSKKGSGWLWVLWVALLLAIGAGVGAAIYFLVLPIL